MNQKVVFLDVDGTIVNDKGIIPESTQIAIRKAVENGHKLVVCSGRSLFQLPQMLLDLGFSGMVTAAGAQVIAGGKEIIIRNWFSIFSNYFDCIPIFIQIVLIIFCIKFIPQCIWH